MMKPSPREQRLFEAMKKNPGISWDVETCAKLLYGDRDRPLHWRNSTVVALRMLAIKTLNCSIGIERSSEVGRGNALRYRVVKRKKEDDAPGRVPKGSPRDAVSKKHR
jgi:hypothetical protein